MQNTFSFTLRVDINLDDVNAEKRSTGQHRVLTKMANTLSDEKIHGKNLKKNDIAIKFVLDTNPDDAIFEVTDRVFLDELIDGSFNYIRSYVQRIKDELEEFKAATSEKHYAAKGALLTAALGETPIPSKVGNKTYFAYQMNYRNISKIVYRKNSPALANVHFQSSLNGDLQPPGTGKQP